MIIRSATFIKSSPKVGDCPKSNLPEYAFIGRSNVGKSSLINMLADKKGLALTGSTPGKTLLINHFIINSEWHLVDLPGYGYAKRSYSMLNNWDMIINSYFETSSQISLIFFLVDSRHELTENDRIMFDYLLAKRFPFCIVGTKSDKLSKTEKQNATKYLSRESRTDIILASSQTGEGIEIIKKLITDTIEGIKK